MNEENVEVSMPNCRTVVIRKTLREFVTYVLVEGNLIYDYKDIQVRELRAKGKHGPVGLVLKTFLDTEGYERERRGIQLTKRVLQYVWSDADQYRFYVPAISVDRYQSVVLRPGVYIGEYLRRCPNRVDELARIAKLLLQYCVSMKTVGLCNENISPQSLSVMCGAGQARGGESLKCKHSPSGRALTTLAMSNYGDVVQFTPASDEVMRFSIARTIRDLRVDAQMTKDHLNRNQEMLDNIEKNIEKSVSLEMALAGVDSTFDVADPTLRDVMARLDKIEAIFQKGGKNAESKETPTANATDKGGQPAGPNANATKKGGQPAGPNANATKKGGQPAGPNANTTKKGGQTADPNANATKKGAGAAYSNTEPGLLESAVIMLAYWFQ